MGLTGFDSGRMLRKNPKAIKGKQINVDFAPRLRAVA